MNQYEFSKTTIIWLTSGMISCQGRTTRASSATSSSSAGSPRRTPRTAAMESAVAMASSRSLVRMATSWIS